jgi:hypothetical protein
MTIGRRTWAVPEGYIPGRSTADSRDLVSHDALCFLNATEQDAHVQVTVFFTDRDPAGPYHVLVPARRSKHVRINELRDPEPIPTDTEYSTIVESDVPVVVQYTRLDSRQAANALLSTIAFAADA